MIYCAIAEKDIDCGACVVVCDIVNDMLKETVFDDILPGVKIKSDYKDVCWKCKHRYYKKEKKDNGKD